MTPNARDGPAVQGRLFPSARAAATLLRHSRPSEGGPMLQAPTAHPTLQKLADYSAGKLPPDQMAFIAGHLAACAECRRAVEGLAPEALCQRPPGTAMAAAREVAALPAEVPPDLARSQKYRVLGRLGQGGMGAVFKAEQLRMARAVAIKVMSPEMVGDPEALRRFQAEA